jgi:putative NADH-flavin reductase
VDAPSEEQFRRRHGTGAAVALINHARAERPGFKPGAISGPDFATAIIDEIENPTHRRQRFTVAN